MFTQAVSVGVFAERHDLDRNNPAEIAVAKDRKNPIENVTLGKKPCPFQENIASFGFMLLCDRLVRLRLSMKKSLELKGLKQKFWFLIMGKKIFGLQEVLNYIRLILLALWTVIMLEIGLFPMIVKAHLHSQRMKSRPIENL